LKIWKESRRKDAGLIVDNERAAIGDAGQADDLIAGSG